LGLYHKQYTFARRGAEAIIGYIESWWRSRGAEQATEDETIALHTTRTENTTTTTSQSELIFAYCSKVKSSIDLGETGVCSTRGSTVLANSLKTGILLKSTRSTMESIGI
jgi:hypothetical protein